MKETTTPVEDHDRTVGARRRMASIDPWEAVTVDVDLPAGQ